MNFTPKLRLRLFFGLLPFVLIVLAMGGYAIALFSQLAQDMDVAVTKNYGSIVAAHGMSRAVGGMDREARAAAATRTSDMAAFFEHQKRFEEYMAMHLKQAQVPGEDVLMQQVTENYESFLETNKALFLSMETPDPLRAPKDQRSRRALSFSTNAVQLQVLLEKLRDLNYQAVLKTHQGIQDTTSDVKHVIITGIVIVILLSIATWYQLSRSIAKPVHDLTSATRALGEGRFDKPVPVVSNDELGELAKAFNMMAAQLEVYRQSTSEELVRLHRTTETTLA
ncbi:MAG TPA: HAMP domain-containing protein, partial [Pyrinomonadaceae bacterium]|nr:HAMP domain-containing protein [Pyrinomonadaceae bacterium]